MSATQTNHTRLSGLIETTDGIDPPARDDCPCGDSHDKSVDGKCLICGLEGLCWPVKKTHGVFSGAFTSTGPLSDGDGICYRCRYLSNQMDYRRYHWLATEDGVEVIKERPRLVEVLLDPPEGSWMLKYKDESDFLTVLNAWIYGQRLNRSRDQFDILVDKRRVSIEREAFAEMIAFGRDLRNREDAPAKRVLLGDITPSDFSRYDLSREDFERIRTDYADSDVWRVAVQLIE